MAAPSAQVPKTMEPFPPLVSHDVAYLVTHNEVEALKSRNLSPFELEKTVMYAVGRQGYEEMFDFYFPKLTNVQKQEILVGLKEALSFWERNRNPTKISDLKKAIRIFETAEMVNQMDQMADRVSEIERLATNHEFEILKSRYPDINDYEIERVVLIAIGKRYQDIFQYYFPKITTLRIQKILNELQEELSFNRENENVKNMIRIFKQGLESRQNNISSRPSFFCTIQ